MISKKTSEKKGFTLIELLLVLVILAVLGVVVVPKFTNRSKQAKETAAIVTIANVEVALDAFEIDNGRYPTTSEGLKALRKQPSNADDWKGPYLKKTVTADPWGNDYVYKQPGQHNEYGYDLFSFGPDGRQGSEDDVANWSEDD